VKRIWIDKEDGKQRPIGITALEDKIVQKAVTSLLEIVYQTKVPKPATTEKS
jgi:retron-type reverse transcriptase